MEENPQDALEQSEQKVNKIVLLFEELEKQYKNDLRTDKLGNLMASEMLVYLGKELNHVVELPPSAPEEIKEMRKVFGKLGFSRSQLKAAFPSRFNKLMHHIEICKDIGIIHQENIGGTVVYSFMNVTTQLTEMQKRSQYYRAMLRAIDENYQSLIESNEQLELFEYALADFSNQKQALIERDGKEAGQEGE